MLPLETFENHIEPDTVLYHISSRGKAFNMVREGLPPHTQWVIAEEAMRLSRLLESAGQTPLTIPMPFKILKEFTGRPDYEIIGELNHGFMDSEQIKFANLGRNVEASLKVYGSMRASNFIPGGTLCFYYPHLKEIASVVTRKERREEQKLAKKAIHKMMKQKGFM